MNKKISALFIEDSQDDCDLIIRELKKNNLDVTYKRVECEKTLLTELSNNWDVILSDYNLPNFNGAEALKICRSNNVQTPFIIISGSVGEDLAIDLMRSGANDFVLKDRISRLAPAIIREIEYHESKKRNLENERKLNVSLEQVRHLQKLEAMGLLASGIAHDFNNILAAMQLYFSQLKKSEDSLIKTYGEKLTQIHTRAVGLTRQILSFSRRQPNIVSEQNLNSNVSEIQDMLSTLLGSQIQIEIDQEPNLNTICANKSQVDQVIMNLAINARDAMKNSGQLIIKTRNFLAKASERMTSGELPAGNYIQLSVTDSGTGMEQDIIDRIFEPFFTTKGPDRGSGLGLSIVHGIVKTMRGEIQVTSTIGQGTTFSVYIPQASENLTNGSVEKSL
jgi:signal transduction histidine kinase